MLFVKMWIIVSLIGVSIYLLMCAIWELGRGYVLGLFGATECDDANDFIAYFEKSKDPFERLMIWEAKRQKRKFLKELQEEES